MKAIYKLKNKFYTIVKTKRLVTGEYARELYRTNGSCEGSYYNRRYNLGFYSKELTFEEWLMEHRIKIY